MSRDFIDKLVISGAVEFMPAKIAPSRIVRWDELSTSVLEGWKSARAFVENPMPPAEKLVAVCNITEVSLNFTVFDVMATDPKSLNILERAIGFEDLGPDQVMSYMMTYPLPERGRYHEQIAGSLLKKLDEVGLSFENEEGAKDMAKALTAYWFDLWDVAGKLDPRNALMAKMAPKARGPKRS